MDFNITEIIVLNMGKCDPEQTARNKKIKALTAELKELLPNVLRDTGIESQQSLHGTIGGKNDAYIDLERDVIHSPEQYISIWLTNLKKETTGVLNDSMHRRLYDLLQSQQSIQEYLYKFLERTYLREYENLSKNRPTVEESEIWIGQNNANYGLLITPRFVNNCWENDKSEIKRFKKRYWSIGHVLETGFVIPDKEEKITFSRVEEYLNFFENVIVRHSASPYQKAIASLYSEYVKTSDNPEDVLLLIPELRYEGIEAKHKYRLDFCIIDVESNNKIGFEFSPSSTHTKLTGTKNKTQKEINAEASSNFDKEMKKHKDYFRKHGIFCLIYTDEDLKDSVTVFQDIRKYLEPKEVTQQIQYHILSNFFERTPK